MLRFFPERDVRSFSPGTRLRSLPIVRDLPVASFLCCWLLGILIFIFMVFRPPPSQGLRIELWSPKALRAEQNPWAQALGVYVEEDGQFSLNGKRVARENLRKKLEEELARRMPWVVYVEAHENSAFSETMFAIETIQGLGAKAVWITPRMRSELELSGRGGGKGERPLRIVHSLSEAVGNKTPHRGN